MPKGKGTYGSKRGRPKRMSIQNVETKKLKQMLRMKNFQDKDSQKMIKDEIKFRKEGMSLEDMTKIFQGKTIKKFRR
tara:strand:- start:49 stop:279 length:231 start_codon:yes stop_codon:yes gene_type:complete